MEQEKFESFAIVEIMGHIKVAGMARTIPFGNTTMLRVDIPETKKQPAFTKMYGMHSVFSISPVDEGTARECAEAFNVNPIQIWEVERSIEKRVQEGVKAGVDRELLRLNSTTEQSNEVDVDNDFEEHY